MCDKSVSTTNLNPDLQFFCAECEENKKQDKAITKRGLERAEKDDEEEWGRIPIPQSDGSDEDTWLDELSGHSSESEQEEEICTLKQTVARANRDDSNHPS
jgi:hypothetical protein